MSRTINQESLQEIGNYIISGMSEKESCILVDVSYEQLQELMKNNEQVRDFIERKRVKFKFNHLREIQKNKSEKNSQWLLEKLRPDEFGSKAKSQEAPTINIISAIIKDIQHDDQSIVRISRGNREGGESNNISPDRLSIREALG